MSNPTTTCVSNIPEEKIDNKENQKGKEVCKTDEITKVADGQDVSGVSHMAISVVLEPSSREDRYEAGLVSKPSTKSYPNRSDLVLSTTVKNVSSQLQSEKQSTGIPETRGASKERKRVTQSKEFSEQGSVECANVIPCATDAIGQVSDRPVELQPSDTTTEDSNKKDDDQKIKEEKEDDKQVPQLQQEPDRISVEVHERGVPEAKKRIVQSRDEQREVKTDMPQTVQQGNTEQVVDFSAKDLLSLAWQIAQGMV